MSIQHRAPRTTTARSPHRTGQIPCVGALCGLLFALMLLAPGVALADSMSLSMSPEPVANLTSEVTYTASSGEGTLAVVAANNPGVPCAANPAAYDGQTITPGHIFDAGSVGGVNYEPAAPGRSARRERVLAPELVDRLARDAVVAARQLAVTDEPAGDVAAKGALGHTELGRGLARRVHRRADWYGR